uniref:Putative secreted protein n=1 Tax=Anopheles triannulatus TaxID=58253 RepID=A0A2M4B4A9_9DIPT
MFLFCFAFGSAPQSLFALLGCSCTGSSSSSSSQVMPRCAHRNLRKVKAGWALDQHIYTHARARTHRQSETKKRKTINGS